MNIIKNLTENKKGNIVCQLLRGDTWVDYIMPKDAEYELHESSDWQEIKPCDPAEKSAHELQQAKDAANQEAKAYLASTDWYVMRKFDSGEPMPEDVRDARAEARAKVS